ncbi:MAG: sensor hybrid histidine kinase [Phycisphaerales bacterium]|nr:sensor hybrid histidine kinase [Phycisphaerales bacterium]
MRVVVQRVNSRVEVTVADNGVGMTPSFIAHAFERFRQSDSRETQQTGGLGLGLSIVKNLIEMHGGSISAASKGTGKGSTFLINLPVAVVHTQRAETDRVHPHATLSDTPFEVRGITLEGVKVVIVEDEQDSRDVLERLLSSSGAEVSIATSAAEALALLERVRPHVLVSDIGLPGEDGYELIRKVRMLGDGLGNVRAVALTAFARAEDRTKAMLAGFQMHLAKPVDARELIVTVATLAMK